MNSIIFIQREIEEKLGVMVLTAYLRSLGHEARIVVNPRKNIRLLKKLRPEIIGISLLTPSLKWALATARFIKAELPDTLLIRSYFQESMISDQIKRNSFFNAQKLSAYLLHRKVSYGQFVRLVNMPAWFARVLYPPVFYWFFGSGLRERYDLSWFVLFRYWLYSRS